MQLVPRSSSWLQTADARERREKAAEKRRDLCNTVEWPKAELKENSSETGQNQNGSLQPKEPDSP